MAVSEQEVLGAEERMAAARRNGFAISARYDGSSDRVVIALDTGIEIAFPPRLAEGLADADPDALAVIEISASGLGLHWPLLDADLYVPSLLQGILGSKRWMAAQRAAAGGRPRSAAREVSGRDTDQAGEGSRKPAVGRF